tara:strand:+ start:48 stop:509 length:462 start_codon:yes stop_codon:yes gene_type:complete
MVPNKETKTDSYLKIFGGVVFIVSILVLISQVIIDFLISSSIYVLSAELFVFIPIYTYYIIMLIVSWKVMKNIQNYKNIKKGAMIGSLIGGGISLAILAMVVFQGFYSGLGGGSDFRFSFIVTQLYLGYPSIIVGAVLGILVTWVHNKIKKLG